jgi:hypothetical protein
MSFEKKQFDDHKDQTGQENEQRDPVDPMHIPHPLRMRGIRVPLLYVEILTELSPDTHIKAIEN